jgi:hypothetical protein
VIGAEAVMTEPSGALSVNQTGEEVCECAKEVTKRETTTKMTADNLRMRPAFLNAPSNQKAQDAQAFVRQTGSAQSSICTKPVDV